MNIPPGKLVDCAMNEQEMFEKVAKQVICELFNKPDIDLISKRALINALYAQFGKTHYLATELYFINPSHEFFNNLTLDQKNELIKSKIPETTVTTIYRPQQNFVYNGTSSAL